MIEKNETSTFVPALSQNISLQPYFHLTEYNPFCTDGVVRIVDYYTR